MVNIKNNPSHLPCKSGRILCQHSPPLGGGVRGGGVQKKKPSCHNVLVTRGLESNLTSKGFLDFEIVVGFIIFHH